MSWVPRLVTQRTKLMGIGRLGNPSPSTRAPLAVINASEKYDLVSRTYGTTVAGTFAQEAGKFGLARRYTRGSYQAESWPTVISQYEFTILLVGGLLQTNAGINTVISAADELINTLFIGEWSNNSMTFRLSASIGGTAQVAIGESGGDRLWAFRMLNQTISLWRDGVLMASAAQTGTMSNTVSIKLGENGFAADSSSHIYELTVLPYGMTDGEIRDWASNPRSIFAKVSRPIFISVPTTVTAYYPNSDISVATWTASTGVNLYACINETTPSDAEYITSPDLSTPATFGYQTPVPAGTWDFKFRSDKTGTNGQVRILVKDSGGTTLATGAWHAATGTFTTYTDTLTIASAADRFTIELQT